MSHIYVDHAATTPLHKNVIDLMTELMHNNYGNPSSIHSFGREARKVIDDARMTVANSINCRSEEIVFTSGGTEANNLALLGVARANRSKGNHIITTKIEHHSVLHVCEQLEQEGFEVTYLDVDEHGLISLEQLQKSLGQETILISIMYCNNEVGTIQPINEVAELLTDRDIIFHTDAVQAFGMEEIDLAQLNVDLLSASAHKIGGPKGAGFLYVKDNVKLNSLQKGGQQERRMRAGTENIHAIAGFKEAVIMANDNRSENKADFLKWKKMFIDYLQNENIDFEINGSEQPDRQSPHILNISFAGMDIETFLVNLDIERIAASSGSACTAGTIEPSHVLVAMFGKNSPKVKNSVRFSFGSANNDEQITELGKRVCKIIKRLKIN